MAAFSIFSTKPISASKNSRELVRTDADDAQDANVKMTRLHLSGHQIYDVVANYEAPQTVMSPSGRRLEPSSVRKLTEVYGAPRKRR
jgi:hypothetical protein